MESLAYYTVQLASPEGGWSQLPQLSANARQASDQMKREGIPVRFVRTIFVPEDETCFYLFEAASATAVREAGRRAAVLFERVVEAVAEPQREES